MVAGAGAPPSAAASASTRWSGSFLFASAPQHLVVDAPTADVVVQEMLAATAATDRAAGQSHAASEHLTASAVVSLGPFRRAAVRP